MINKKDGRMYSFVSNGWVISLTSILITFAVTPWLLKTGDWIRSRHGPLTGTYLELSQDGVRSTLLAELIECRHVGQDLKGKIKTRARVSLAVGGIVVNSAPEEGTYSFAGRMLARQLLLSYLSDSNASQNGGTMTMTLDASGWVLRGIWCGTASDGRVISGSCMWVRDSDGTLKNMEVNQLGKYVESTLQSYENPWLRTGQRTVKTELSGVTVLRNRHAIPAACRPIGQWVEH
jgi:hypothetical protein